METQTDMIDHPYIMILDLSELEGHKQKKKRRM